MNISALKRAAEQATPGPWKWNEYHCGLYTETETDELYRWVLAYAPYEGMWLDGKDEEANATLIASCDPQTVLKLIACVEALRAFVDANENGPATEWTRRMVDCHNIARRALQELGL